MGARNIILDALLALLVAPGVFPTSGRKLLLWSQCNVQPALFLRHVRDAYPSRPTGMPSKLTMECEVWIYCNTGADPTVAASVGLADLLDSVALSLVPRPGREAQTLGGLVIHAWIEGTIDIHPGDLDGQAIAVVPVRMLVPSANGG